MPRPAMITKLLVTAMQGRTYSQLLTADVATGKLLLWFKMNEASGTAVTNYGASGSALNGTNSNATVNQTGYRGAGEAYDFVSASDSVVAVGNHAAINALPAFTYAALVKNDNTGGAGLGRYFEWSDAATTASTLHINTATDIRAARLMTGGGAVNATSIARFASTIVGAYYWVFCTFDNTGDRKLYIYRGLPKGTLESPSSYTDQTAGVGTLTTETASLRVGNRGGGARGIDGLYDEFLLFNEVKSTGWMQSLLGY